MDDARTILVVIFEWISTALTTFRCLPVVYWPGSRSERDVDREGILPKNSAYKKILSEGEYLARFLRFIDLMCMVRAVVSRVSPSTNGLCNSLKAIVVDVYHALR